MSYIIAGLGNPDPEYTGTRHSLGRAVVQQLARSSGLGTKNKLVTPDNYMNNSGVALKLLVKNAKQAERLVAVYDDLDLPVGALKISFNKSSGGHKGLESVIKQLKTKKFIRVRIGISPKNKPADVVAYLMAKPKPAEQAILQKVIKHAQEAIEMIVAEGWPKAASIHTSLQTK